MLGRLRLRMLFVLGWLRPLLDFGVFRNLDTHKIMMAGLVPAIRGLSSALLWSVDQAIRACCDSRVE
jgi:hypothetical protein